MTEFLSMLLTAEALPVRFLHCNGNSKTCARPRLVFELTRVVGVAEAVCLAREIAKSVAASGSFPGGFCVEIVLPCD